MLMIISWQNEEIMYKYVHGMYKWYLHQFEEWTNSRKSFLREGSWNIRRGERKAVDNYTSDHSEDTEESRDITQR